MWTLFSNLLFALHPAAAAVRPLLYDGDTAQAVQHVVVDAALDPWELRPVTLEQLLPGEGVVIFGVDGEPAASQVASRGSGCASGGATNASLRDGVELAEKLVLKQRWDDARARLARVEADLPCLVQPAEASLVSRAFFLDGVVAVQQDRPDDALDAFFRAQQFAPDRAWDDRYPPDGKGLFDDAQGVLGGDARATIVLGPGFAGEGAGALWLDGRLATAQAGALSVAAGAHLVQVIGERVQTFAIELAPDQTLGLADAVVMRHTDVDTLVGTPILRCLLLSRFGSSTPSWVWTGAQSWSLDTAGWHSFEPTDLDAPRRRDQRSQRLTAAGWTAAGIGVVGAGLGWYGVLRQIAPPDDECTNCYLMRQARLDAHLPWAIASSALAVAGGLSVVVGRRSGGATALSLGPAPSGTTGLSIVWLR